MLRIDFDRLQAGRKPFRLSFSILPVLALSLLFTVSQARGQSAGIYQQPNYWCDMRNQKTGDGDYRNPMQVRYNDNMQPFTWRPMTEDIYAEPNPPTPTPADIINRSGGAGQYQSGSMLSSGGSAPESSGSLSSAPPASQSVTGAVVAPSSLSSGSAFAGSSAAAGAASMGGSSSTAGAGGAALPVTTVSGAVAGLRSSNSADSASTSTAATEPLSQYVMTDEAAPDYSSFIKSN
ncbi:MAG: hypothetical protein HY986_17165 [Candidatus Melainabacteria bacterium]|nr:hypothetical protein [Candidatus Melainabacteria bacterium]